MRIRLDRHIEKHLQSVKTKMNKPTGYKQSTNLQTKWPMISMVSGEVRISIISKLELHQGIMATHILESQAQA